MSETFVKLFGSITESTIWDEDSDTRIIWVTMLAMADRFGYVGASVPGLAARARVSVPKVRIALEKFLGPDPDSRSKEFEGRRIEVADRGWNLLNYDRFRDMRDEEVRKEYERTRKQAQRARARADMSPSVPDAEGQPGQTPHVPESPAVSAQADRDRDREEDPDHGVGSGPALEDSDLHPEARAIPLPQAPYVAPRPQVRIDGFAAANSAHFDRVYTAYPRKDARKRAGEAFWLLAATFPGGEPALADAILAAFPAMLRRAPYNGPNDKRPFLEKVLVERRWEEPQSDPDGAAPLAAPARRRVENPIPD